MVNNRIASHTTRAAHVARIALLVGAAAGCKANLDDSVSIVTTARVLAVRSELQIAGAGGMPTAPAAAPEAEAKISEPIKLTALFVDGSGPVAPAPLQWAFCGERKPLAELGPISPLCLATSGDWFTQLGTGTEVTGAIPADACQQFGSDTPNARPGQPPGRPVDPDPSGGYYQPTRLLLPGPDGPTVTIAETRIQCTLASFSPDLVAAFQQRYHRNTNPEIAALGIKGAPAPWVAADPANANAAPNQVGVGQRVELELSWPSCPTTDADNDGVCGPEETASTCGTCGGGVSVSRGDCCVDPSCKHARGCAGAERYVRLDPTVGALVDRREAMAVAWYATAGAFDFDRAGRRGDDLATTSDNAWRAPTTPGKVTLWVVLRDDRGGVGWKQYTLDVR
jgi:hypothetical protein